MRRLAMAGLVLLATLDLVLVVLAWRHTYGEPRDVAGLPAEATVPEESADASDAPSQTPSPDAEEPHPGHWVLGFAEQVLLVRAPGGPCTEVTSGGLPSVVVITSRDGGATFTEVDVEGISVVTGAWVGDDGRARILGGDRSCAPVTFESVDAGASWRAIDDSPSFWSVLPTGGNRIQAPAGPAAAPCAARSASGIDGTVARIWCADGRLLGTASTGVEWATLGRLPDALDVAYSSPAVGFALAPRPNCRGTAVLATNDGGTTWRQVHCTTLEGPLGLAADGDAVVVAGRDAVESSSDSGATWARP